MVRPAKSIRLRRLLILGHVLTGLLARFGLFDQVSAAISPVEPPREAGAAPGLADETLLDGHPAIDRDGPSSGVAPRQAALRPTPIFRPDTTMVPSSAAATTTPPTIWFEIGRSVRDAPIRAIRLGSGPIRLALMGSIHGGWERNTERLVLTAYEHFSARPTAIPSALSLYLVPSTNPDSLAAGSGPDAAWNARGVD